MKNFENLNYWRSYDYVLRRMDNYLSKPHIIKTWLPIQNLKKITFLNMCDT